jgi:hypothetical protein
MFEKIKKLFYIFLISLFIISPVNVSAQENPPKSEIFPTNLDYQGALYTLESEDLSQVIVPFGPFFHQDYYAGLPILPVQPIKTKKEWHRLMALLSYQIENKYNVTVYNMIIQKSTTNVWLLVTTNYYSPFLELKQNTSNFALEWHTSSDNKFTYRFKIPYKIFIGGDGLPHPIDPDPNPNSLGSVYFDLDNWELQSTNLGVAHFKFPQPAVLGNYYAIPWDEFESDRFILASNTSVKFNGEFVARYYSPSGKAYDSGYDWGGAPAPPNPPQLPDDNNWWNWLNPLYWIGRLWNLILSPLWDLLQWGFESITDFVFVPVVDGLKFLFLPSQDSLLNLYNNTIGVLREKVPIFDFAFGTLTAITGFTALETYPDDYNPLPALSIPFWGVNNQQVIDLSWFRIYRPMIFDWITYIAWFFFLRKLIKTIPLMFEK